MSKKMYRAGQGLPPSPPPAANAPQQLAPPSPVVPVLPPPQPPPTDQPWPARAVEPAACAEYRPMPAPRRRSQKPRRKKWPIALALVLALALGLGTGSGLALWLRADDPGPAVSVSTGGQAALPPPVSSMVPPGAEPALTYIAAATPRAYSALPLPDEMRAMWFSFLEWRDMDFSSEAAVRAELQTRFDNCAAMGLNTVLVMVRPFGDALYESALFPWSHVMNGAQGQAPGFDPLAVMIEEAHARGLRLEAWLNPYRVQHPTNGPDALSADNPAAQNPEWVRTVNSEVWYNPGLPEVEALVVQSVLEIVQSYDVDGIHFDDYFYPDGADENFDAEAHAQYGAGVALAQWRLENISRMVGLVKQAVEAVNPGVSFGISVQGNNSANLGKMYADVNRWLAEDGFADYIMPQIYWGFGHESANGDTSAAFDNRAAEWAAFARAGNVRLYCGLAAYRIGLLQPDGTRAEFGGNGSGDNSEWESGHAMADQVAHLRTVTGFSGFALFRYDFLYQPNDAVSAAEVSALTDTTA